MSDAFVYGLRAKDSDRYFYVGSTLYPKKRLADHLAAVQLGTNKNRHFCNTVRKVGADCVVMDILETVPEDTRWDAEVQWIQKMTAGGTKLTNRYHNGFEYEYVVERRFEDYADQYPLTPETWRAAEQMRREGFQGGSALERRIHDLMCLMMHEIETRHPDELSEILNGFDS